MVATLGMSLTIPLAMLADMVIHGRHYSAIYILGSAQVMIVVLIKRLCVSFLDIRKPDNHPFYLPQIKVLKGGLCHFLLLPS